MGPIAGKRKLVYSTSRSNDRNADFVKRRRTEYASDSSSSYEQEDEDEKGEASSDSDAEPNEVKLKQTVDIIDIEITRKRDEMLQEADIPDLSLSDPSKSFKPEIVDQSQQQMKKLKIRSWHMSRYHLPAILYTSELIEKTTPLLGIVKDMYRGVIDSHYKFQATQACTNSQYGFLSTKEFRSMDLTKFTAGYYGLKRQLRVGEEILKHYKAFLLKRQGNTMKWWGLADFANYVLAPEVLTSLCIQEMRLGDDIYDRSTRDKAYDIFTNTTEFGLLVADSDPLEPWETALEEHQLKEMGLEPAKHGSSRFRQHHSQR